MHWRPAKFSIFSAYLAWRAPKFYWFGVQGSAPDPPLIKFRGQSDRMAVPSQFPTRPGAPVLTLCYARLRDPGPTSARGRAPSQFLLEHHFPYVLPIVFELEYGRVETSCLRQHEWGWGGEARALAR